MGRPIIPHVTIKVVVVATSRKTRSPVVQNEGVWYHPSTLLRNLFNQFTRDGHRLLLHQATSAFLACDPVVDVVYLKQEQQWFLVS